MWLFSSICSKFGVVFYAKEFFFLIRQCKGRIRFGYYNYKCFFFVTVLSQLFECTVMQFVHKFFVAFSLRL